MKLQAYFCVDDEYYPVRTATFYTKESAERWGATKVYSIDVANIGVVEEEYYRIRDIEISNQSPKGTTNI